MSYRIFRFGTTILPALEASHEVGGGASKLGIVETPGGQVDVAGTARVERALHTVQFDGRLFGEPEAVQTQLDALKPLRGTAARLYRRMPSGAVQWAWARCDSIYGVHGSRNGRLLPISMVFVILSPVWAGANHDSGLTFDSGLYFDDGLYFDSSDVVTLSGSPQTVTVTNGGNATVRNGVITVTAGTAAITALAITASGVHLVFGGTIGAGKSLVIDCGARTVKNDGVDAYSGFSLGAGHTSENWMPLEAGDTSVVVTYTGGGTGGTVLFSFFDGVE